MSREQSHIKTRSGFSSVEALLAVALFALLATGLTGAYLYGQEAPMTNGNRSRATLIAEEGIEALRNIRDGAFASLTDGSHGIASSSGAWVASGTSDTTGIFTRTVEIGTIDTYRKFATSTVTWQENAQRSGSVSLTTRLTDWQRIVATAGGLLIYGDGSTAPRYRTYDTTGNSFSAAATSTISASGVTFALKTSPTKTEALAGFVTSGGVLYLLCYNGSSWSADWSVTVGGTGSTRRFDIAYETNSGDAIVLYSTNTGTTNELAYRTKAGSASCGSWGSATNLDPVRTSGVVHWVKMASDRRSSSNLITAIWADVNSDLSAMVWSGSSWGNEPSATTETSLEVVASAQDIEDFDIEYESSSGDVMVVWANSAGSNGTNGVRYRTCTGGTATCTWGAVTTPPTFNDDATTLDISANPSTDQIVFASIGNAGNDLQIGYWSGSTWTNTANADTSCNRPLAGEKLVATGWLISGGTTRSVVRYGDQGSSNADWYTGNGSTFTKQTDGTISPSVNNPSYFDIQMDPINKNQFMSLVSGAGGLYAKRLIMTSTPAFTWSNSDGSTLTTLLPQSIASPYGFAFWRQ